MRKTSNLIKKPISILVLSIFILFFPLIIRFVSILPEMFFLESLDRRSFLLEGNLNDVWVFGFYGFLGFGIYKLNNWARWILLIHMFGLASLAPLSIGYCFFTIDKKIIVESIQKHGLFEIVILPWIGIFLNSVIAFVILVYLCKADVRKLFTHKKDDDRER
jgi:hypothetical protein